MVGLFEDGRLTLHEVHRANHGPIDLPSGLHWPVTDLWRIVREGLEAAGQWSQTHQIELASAGVDTWGVDFGLLGASGELLNIPHCHRDAQHEAAYNHALQTVGQARLYEATGIQLMPINTLYQLVSLNQREPDLLKRAHRLLFMPDLLHYWLTGEQYVERTIASTSQMLDPHTAGPAAELLAELGLPTHLIGETVPPGSTVGRLRPAVAETTGAPAELPIVAPASHDTASAVAAVPADGQTNWAYLSSGTWSLMGAKIDQPCLTEATRDAGFTHELGVTGFRFLKNIIGLWMLQQCRRYFASQGQTYDYAELAALAEEAEPFRTVVDPNHSPFLQPGHMPEKIAAFARATDQPEPQGVGQYARCCMESLALKYGQTLRELEKVLDLRFDVLHVVGGGGKNALLNQMTADVIDRPVVVGPYEATATGNVMVQAMGAGEVSDADELRRIVAQSIETDTFEPREAERWQEAQQRFDRLSQQQVATS
jgi:rhamnulokinase